MESDSSRSRDARFVSIIMFLVASLGPIGGVLYSSYWSTYMQLLGMFWGFPFFFTDSSYEYPPPPIGNIYLDPFLFFPFAIPRYAFVFMMYRHYSGIASRTKTILTGLVSEMVLPTIYLISFLQRIMAYPGMEIPFPLLIPTPLLLLIGYILIRLRSPSEDGF